MVFPTVEAISCRMKWHFSTVTPLEKA